MQVHHDNPELSHFVSLPPTLRHEATDLERRRHAESSHPRATTEINLTTHERTRTGEQTHASQTSGHVKNGHDRNLVTHEDINTIKCKSVETHAISNQHTTNTQTNKQTKQLTKNHGTLEIIQSQDRNPDKRFVEYTQRRHILKRSAVTLEGKSLKRHAQTRRVTETCLARSACEPSRCPLPPLGFTKTTNTCPQIKPWVLCYGVRTARPCRRRHVARHLQCVDVVFGRAAVVSDEKHRSQY